MKGPVSVYLYVKFLGVLFRGRGGMLQSLAILYAEYALARKIKYNKIFSDFANKSPIDRRLCRPTVTCY